ncbi:hypothetical protein IIC65_07950, partial [Candidatus Sumerlaeota bacterium]|nr:hypothetical protein [Candidatus Sumerlaeota bacterium]
MRRTDTQRLGPHLLFAALGFSVILAPRGAAAQDTQAEEAGEAVQQVRLEVTLLEWRLNNTMDFDFAVRFTGRPGSILGAADLTLLPSERLSAAARLFLTGLDTGHGSFDVVIEALETVGKTTVLSESEVIVPVGESEEYSARVSSGTRIPFESVRPLGVRLASTTEYQDTGITLECTIPAIKYGDLVHLDLRTSVTDSIDRISVGLNEDGNPLLVPVVDNREMISEILVRSGSIFIAGLLKSSSEIERRQGIPFISELPFLRRLLARFSKSNEVTELVFLVRPQILPPIGASAPQTPEEPEASLEASSDQSRPWRSDPDAYMIAIDALVIEVNSAKTRDLGLHYGLDSNDPSNILEGIEIGLEN